MQQRRIQIQTVQPPNFSGVSNDPRVISAQSRGEVSTPGWVSNNFNSGGAYPSQKHLAVPNSPTPNFVIGTPKLETSFQSIDGPQKTIYSQSNMSRPPADPYFEEAFQIRNFHEINVYGTPGAKVVQPYNPPVQPPPPPREQENAQRNSLVRESYNPLKVNFSTRTVSVESGPKPYGQQVPGLPRQDHPNDSAVSSLKAQMEALFKERDSIQAENQRLKIANQGLLKDTDFLKAERVRLEESLNQQASEKDAAYQRRIADLNKTVNNLYQQNKVLSDKAEESYQASKANRDMNFDLENNVFELKRQVTSLTDKAKSLELEVTVLRKTDADSKNKINEMKNLLLEADERIYVLEKNGSEAQAAREELARVQEIANSVQRQLAEAKETADTATKNAGRMSDELFAKEKQLEEIRKEFDRLLEALENQEKENVILKTEKDRISQTSVAASAHNLLKVANESLQKEVANLKNLLQETQKSEDFARQSLNELRRKHQHDLTISQKTNQDTHVEYRAQIERLKESLHALEEQAATSRVELEHAELTVKNLRAEKERHAFERVTSEAKVVAAERKAASLEEEVAKLQKMLAEAKEVNEIDSRFKFSEGKKLAELKAENLALKKEVMDMKAKLIVANAKSQAEYNRSQKAQQSASILSMADTSMNDGEAAVHRECRRKIRGLQNDYVELQNENMKLRDDVFRLREEKIENLDRSLRMSKVNNSRRLLEGPEAKARGMAANVLENAAEILNGSFLKSPAKHPAEFNVESVLLDQEGAAKALEEVRRTLLAIVGRWEEKFKTLRTSKEATARQLVKRLEDIVGECISKNEEFGAMSTAIEEANQMIAKLEVQKRALLDELRDGPSSSFESGLR